MAAVSPTHRECRLEISNATQSYPLTDRKMYFLSGGCVKDLPWEVEPQTTGSGVFAKTPHAARGAVGVVTYKLSSSSQNVETLAIMFSVPFDFNAYSNWFAVGVFDSTQSCDYDLYYEMYYNSSVRFMRAQGGNDITFKHGGVVIKASMANTYTPELTVLLK